MVRHQKQYNTIGMVDNKKNFKVKEEEDENMNTKEKRKQNKVEGDKKAEEKQNSLKRKMAKYKEEKEKKTRIVDKKNDEEKERVDGRKRKENEKKAKSHKERKEENENGKEEQEEREIEKEKEQEQKEINEHKGRKENDKEEEESKDENDKNNCPQFFRVFMSYSFMEHVTIPVQFHKYLEECTGMVSLRGPSGNKWPVELAKISGELCFARGWKEFLSDHRVGYGCLLVFRYDGQSQFSVTVFLPSSCEAPYASLAQPQRKDVDIAGEEEKGLTSTNADGTAPQEDDAHTGASAHGTPQNESSEEEEEEEEEDASEEEEAEEEEDALSETLENEENSECRMCSDDVLEPAQQQQEDQRKTDDGFVVGKRARFRKVDDIMAEVDRSNKSKPAEGKNSQAPSGDPAFEEATSSDSLAESEHRPPKQSKDEETRSPSGDSASKAAASSDNLAELASRPSKESKAEGKSSAGPFVYTRSTASASKRASEGAASSDNLAVHTGVFAPESVCTDLTAWHRSFGKRHSMQDQFPMFNKSNGENQPGKVLIKVTRRPGLTSQRRPVTQRDKEDAMERARRFKSERPFTIKAMKHNDVYASYFMIIPDKFVKAFLPKESRKMTLWDPQAKPWKVWYEYTGGERPRAAFSAGWGALAMENNLERWDACVFELLDQEYNIKLHVHRAVLMITPCLLAPKPRTDE